MFKVIINSFLKAQLNIEYLKIFIHYDSKSTISNSYNHNTSVIIFFCTFNNFNICKIFSMYIIYINLHYSILKHDRIVSAKNYYIIMAQAISTIIDHYRCTPISRAEMNNHRGKLAISTTIIYKLSRL